jgi:hypothetical protein
VSNLSEAVRSEKEGSSVEQHVIDAYEQFQEILLDSIINLPPDGNDNTYILVVIDNFTKFVELFVVADVLSRLNVCCMLLVAMVALKPLDQTEVVSSFLRGSTWSS